MDPTRETRLLCKCQGEAGEYDESSPHVSLEDAVNCQSIENLNGVLNCGDDGSVPDVC